MHTFLGNQINQTSQNLDQAVGGQAYQAVVARNQIDSQQKGQANYPAAPGQKLANQAQGNTGNQQDGNQQGNQQYGPGNANNQQNTGNQH